MKRLILLFVFIFSQYLSAQQISTNRNPIGLEHNLLFNASTRYSVNSTGPALILPTLFDGAMLPSYTNVAPTATVPTVILIENLPNYHTQAGSWVGWSTRYWPAKRFKIEGFDTYYTNSWKTLSDYSVTDYNGSDFKAEVPSGSYTKLRFTFYVATGSNGYLGVSELFFIHPEAMSPYQGLLASSVNNWDNNGANLYYNSAGKVGIGTTAPDEKLTVKGKIHTQEVKVDMTGSLVPDYVFAPEYKLKTLGEVAEYIKENRHLPEIPSAKEIEFNGLHLAEMNMKLLKKIEELTLYVMDLDKNNKDLLLQLKAQEKRIKFLEKSTKKN